MVNAVITVRNVHKSYKIDGDVFFHALRGVSLEVKPKEFVAIVGPSGCGKSTLMHIIGLLDKPSTGQVLVDGRDAAHLNDDKLSTLRSGFVGFVFQQFNLINKLTILENVLLPTIYTRHALSYDATARAKELLTRFGIGDKANSYPNKISGGQQQRVAIARALIMKPQLILADEPTGNLDTKTGEEIMKLFKELNHEGITIVLVTHDPDIARQAGRMIRIRDGLAE